MIETLIEPFGYGYMWNAMWVSSLVGGVCAFLSCYLMLKGWSLIGDALSHSVVPGVAGAYILGLPFALGAFIAGGLAAGAMLFLSGRSGLKIDVIIGIIFTSFFGLGLFMVSLSPMAVNIQTIILGNILAITPEDTLQLAIIGFVSLGVLLLKWKDMMVVFFDENHARSIGLNPELLRAVFFVLLSAAVVAAMMTVGAFLVIALVVTPGATAYLLCDRFPRLIVLSVLIGTVTSFVGAYASYFLATFHHLPPRLQPHYDNISDCQFYTFVAYSLRQPWCPLPRGPQGRGPLPTLANWTLPLVPAPGPARGLAEQLSCSDGTTGGTFLELSMWVSGAGI